MAFLHVRLMRFRRVIQDAYVQWVQGSLLRELLLVVIGASVAGAILGFVLSALR